MDSLGLKECTECKETLPIIISFYFSKGRYKAKCKECILKKLRSGKKKGRRWAIKEKNLALTIDLHGQGYSLKRISKALGVSKSAVFRRIKASRAT